MSEEIASLTATLVEEPFFEGAATRVLSSMLELTGKTLAASGFAGRGKLLRGLLHLRPGESYRRLVILERSSGQAASWHELDASTGALSSSLLASATAWRSVVEHRRAIAIDVNLGLLQPCGASQEKQWLTSPGNGFSNDESRQRFLERQATHVCVLPLRAPGGGIAGMASLEVECPAAMGREFIWNKCAGSLQLLADVAAPHLLYLPARPSAAPVEDPLLPVVGSTLSGLLPMLRVFAAQDETLALSGATGVGKSRLAQWCHAHSARRSAPFEVLELLNVPEELQMAELFGWRKGAFTHAVRDTQGYIARAEGGTLFIDEIDKLSLRAQAGLLQVLERRIYRVLGEGGAERRANVRFIIGTNVDLRAAMREGRFREDLYYRIHVLPIHLPSLDERRDEIPRWARYMLQRRHRERMPEGQVHLADEAEHLLSTRSWPGNLRQLDNVVRRAYTLGLVEQPSGHDVELQGRHVSQALSYEEPSRSLPLTEQLLASASAFISEAQRRQPGSLDLDLTEAFRGLVLAVASRRLGLEEACRLLGKEQMVRSRNHQRLLRRELEKVASLYEFLGVKDFPFSDLLDPPPGSDT
jgi:transcriptional regulator with AAA-type ATPase domain